MDTVTISKREYEKLLRLKKVDMDLKRQLASSIKDFKEGRFKRIA